MYKFLNVEVTKGGDIIYNFRTGPNVRKVTTLWCVLDVFARLIIDKQNIALYNQTNLCDAWRGFFFSLRRKEASLIMNLFVFVHFNLPHTKANYEWCSLEIGVEAPCEGWHPPCITTQCHGNYYVRVVTWILVILYKLWGPTTYPF